jgi:DNA-binding transcriptional LysR family regulator
MATPRYLAGHGIPRTPADLAGHNSVVYLTPGAGPWTFHRGSTEMSVVVNGRVRVSAAEGVRAAVCADLGIAIVSEWMFAPELASGEVQAVLTEWTLPTIDLWAVYPAGRLASAKARAFASFVEEIMAEGAPAGEA